MSGPGCFCALTFVSVLATAATPHAPQVFAGTVPLGDGGPGSAATLEYPSAIAFDNAGNLYIADALNGRIRKVTTNCIINTIAGTGKFGYSGDEGPAIEARISAYTTGIAAGVAGEVYFSDSGNAVVRKIAADGTIHTILTGASVPGASDTSPFYPGVLALDANGGLYITDINNHQVLRLTSDGRAVRIAGTGRQGDDGDGGPATAARIDLAGGVMVDRTGNIYVADVNAHRVRKITPDGIIHAFAGDGNFGFDNEDEGVDAMFATIDLPWSVRQDRSGNIFILDITQARIRRIDLTGVISTVAGADNLDSLSTGDGGPAIRAQINTPLDMAFAPTGELYVVDSNSQIRVIGLDGRIRTAIGAGHFSGDGRSAREAVFADPSGIAFDAAGNLYVADQNNFRVRRIDPQGNVSTVAGTGSFAVSGDGGPAIEAKIGRPLAVATDATGNVYFAAQNMVRRIAPDGNITTIAGGGSYLSDDIPATDESLAGPSGLVVDVNGTVFIADTFNDRVLKVTADGKIHNVAGTGLQGNSGDNGPAIQALLSNPANLALDAAGNLYIADSGNARVRVITPDGTMRAFAGTGKPGDDGDDGPAVNARLTNPVGIAVDASRNVYIGDAGVKKVRRVTPDGTIQTVAGPVELDSIPNYTTAGGDPLYPQDYDYLYLAVDATGRVFVCDEYRERIVILGNHHHRR
jgi:sugar lactone lactonase YvrE